MPGSTAGHSVGQLASTATVLLQPHAEAGGAAEEVKCVPLSLRETGTGNGNRDVLWLTAVRVHLVAHRVRLFVRFFVRGVLANC